MRKSSKSKKSVGGTVAWLLCALCLVGLLAVLIRYFWIKTPTDPSVETPIDPPVDFAIEFDNYEFIV